MPAHRRKYKPGTRNPNFRDERFSDERFAWLRTYLGQFVILWRENDQDESGTEAVTPTVSLLLTRPGGRPVTYNITSLTRDELDSTRQFFTMLFDMAEPLVDERDKVAHDAAAQGDDSYVRSYRQLPEVVVRKRTVGPDREVLRERPADDADGPADDGSDDAGLRGHGDGLAPETPEDDRTQDDEPTAD